MTPAPDLLADLRRRCRELGIPLTVQRRAVCEVLASRGDHPTADQVWAELKGRLPGISKATAYRTLDKLVELGLIRRASHPGGVVRYDAKTQRHHHLVCERCGAVTDLESGALDAISLPDLSRAGFLMRDFSVHVHGVCSRCARDAPRGSAPRAGGGPGRTAATHEPGSRRNP